MTTENETIAAIATPPGEGGISIVRISGSRSLEIADRIFVGRKRPSEMRGGNFVRGFVRSIADGRTIDEIILLVHRAPHSYTREDVVEIQGHGGVACARRLLEEVLRAGARLAQPGEFTMRAFLNGRIDLTQAEAVADLVKAQSEKAAALAMEQLAGRLGQTVGKLYDRLASVAADIEAMLDFEEGELPSSLIKRASASLQVAAEEVRQLAETWRQGRLVREGVKIVIAGRANAGKSTLMNSLVGRDRSIVTELPGTTRDTIEEIILLEGIPVRLVDTAGIRSTDCKIEKEGIRRAWDEIRTSDLVLYVVDSSQQANREDVTTIDAIGTDKVIIVLSKIDIGCIISASDFPTVKCIPCCLFDRKAITELMNTLSKWVAGKVSIETPFVVSERHRLLLEEAGAFIVKAVELLQSRGELGLVLCASDLRGALAKIGEITGKDISRDILDRIFSQFCVGK